MTLVPKVVVWMLLTVVGLGCARPVPASKPLPAEAWPDAIRIGNGKAELVVVPSIGRIMHFGLVGGKNLLWVNPKTLGAPVQPSKDWQNFGGDKAWVWPQSRWVELGGSDWPPSSMLDPGRWSAERIGDRVILVSQVDRELGLRIRREISLVVGQPTARIVTILEHVGPRPEGVSTRPSSAEPFGAWVITQTPAPDELFVPTVATTTRPWTPMVPKLDPGFVEPVKGGLRIYARPRAQKAGFDASELVARFGEDRLVQRIVGVNEGAYLDPADRAQIYTHSFDETGRALYVELEFTAPPAQCSELVVEWTIERVQ